MSGLGTYLHSALADWINGSAMPTAPVSLHLALSYADPTQDGSGLAEPVGSGYARQVVTFTASANGSGGTKLTSVDPVVFGPVSGSPWSTVTHAALYDQDDNLIDFGPLGVQRTAPVGDTISFGAGSIQFILK